ncbi:hypothetical protein ACQKWADRAFT_296127 [Trichoderma austrokoningii]
MMMKLSPLMVMVAVMVRLGLQTTVIHALGSLNTGYHHNLCPIESASTPFAASLFHIAIFINLTNRALK